MIVDNRHSTGKAVTTARRGEYGYDAPYVLVLFAAASGACFIVAAVSLVTHHTRLGISTGVYALFFLANAFSFLYTTRRGKFAVWDDVLEELRLGGEELVLDIGCG